ncbi:MAG: right-handed parallel beta-helix repeat-containing protein [Polaromonas sp.]
MAMSLHAETYYVDNAGNDNNSGLSPATAWKTLARVNKGTFGAGANILLAAGQTFTGNIFLYSLKGTAAAPITISSQAGGIATIISSAATAILIGDSSGVVISNLKLVGSGASSSTSMGIFLYNNQPSGVSQSYQRMSGLEISGFQSGIKVYGGDGGYDDVQITGSKLYDLKQHGIFVLGSAKPTLWNNRNVVISDNMVWNVYGDPANAGVTGNGILVAQTDSAVMARNVVHDCGSMGKGNVGLWTYQSNRVRIHHNEVYNQKTTTTDGDGLDLDGGVTNSVVEYNYTHDNGGAGILVWQYAGAGLHDNNTVRYNVSVNDGRDGHSYGAVAIGGEGLSNLFVYNNLLIANPTKAQPMPALSIWNDKKLIKNVLLANNIFYSTGGNSFSVSASGLDETFRFVGNDYYDTTNTYSLWSNGVRYTSLSTWRSGARQEILAGAGVGLQLDPMLVSAANAGVIGDPAKLKNLTGYELKNGSPMLGAGINLAKQFQIDMGSEDFFGNPANAETVRDIGVHQPTTSSGAQAAAPLPLILNGGAEAGMTGWTSNQTASVEDATHAHSGSRLFKLAPLAAGSDAVMYQAVQGLGAGSYQASAWYSGAGAASVNGWAIYDLSWKPLAANWSLPANTLSAQQSVLNFTLSGTGSQAGFYVYYQFRASAEGAYGWMDDVVVIKK